MARQLRIGYPGAIYHVTVRGNAQQNIFRDDKDRYLQRSARSIGDDDYREWVDERYAELLSERRRPEDVSFRTGAGKRLAVAGVLEMVAKAAGTTVAGLGARRRGGKWKGIAALLLVKHVGLTRRDCVRWLGLKAGSGVSYQMRQAGQALEADATLARVMDWTQC